MRDVCVFPTNTGISILYIVFAYVIALPCKCMMTFSYAKVQIKNPYHCQTKSFVTRLDLKRGIMPSDLN